MLQKKEIRQKTESVSRPETAGINEDKTEKAVTDKTLPEDAVIVSELERSRYRRDFRRVLRSTVFSLLVVAAATVLIAVLFLPVLQISGTSMADTLEDEDIVIAVNGASYRTGDIVAFYFNNQLLVKRVIAGPGQWVNIDADGNVYVNNQLLEEPYLKEKALGDCDITLPYQVPAEKIFVMGDHRATSVDSRNSGMGCIENKSVVGRIILRVWPLRTVRIIR